MRCLLGCLALVSCRGADGAEDLRWITADAHLHAHGCGGEATSGDLITLMRGQGINLASVLVWGWGFETDVLRFSGGDHPASIPDHILRYDLEVSLLPAAPLGHLVALGLPAGALSDPIVHTASTTLSIARWARSQSSRTVLGMNHAQFWPDDETFPTRSQFPFPPTPLEFPMLAALGEVTFLTDESPAEDENEAVLPLWRRLQNAGFRVTMLGGSDYPCAPIGPRTHVLIDGPMSYDAYLSAIRLGRTVVARNRTDFVELATGGVRIGGEKRVHPGQVLELSLSWRVAESDRLRVFVNGEPALSLAIDAGAGTTTATLAVAGSSWISAQTDWVQTGALYLLVDDEAIHSRQDACYWRDYADHFIQEVQNGQFSERAKLRLDDYRAARDVFDARLTLHGDSCP